MFRRLELEGEEADGEADNSEEEEADDDDVGRKMNHFVGKSAAGVEYF